MAEKQVRDAMTVEDEVVQVLAGRDRKLAELKQAADENRESIEEKDRTLTEKNQAILEKDRILTERNRVIREALDEIDRLRKSAVLGRNYTMGQPAPGHQVADANCFPEFLRDWVCQIQVRSAANSLDCAE